MQKATAAKFRVDGGFISVDAQMQKCELKTYFFSRPRVPVFPVRALGLSLTVGSHMWLILYLPGVRVRGYNSGLRVRLEIDRNFFLTI